MNIFDFKALRTALTIAITDFQWGDGGKGKFVDLFADWADIIARGTGGANAGHTICFNGQTIILNLIPSGILRDSDGKLNIIGNGVAVDPRIVCSELASLRAKGLSYNHLLIAQNAKLVLPQHLVMDRVRETIAGKRKIGTTGRGIGPVYMDHVARTGLILNDILNPDSFVHKLRKNLEEKVLLLRTVDPEVIKKIMQHEHLESGIYHDSYAIFNIDAIVERYRKYALELREMICDTDALLRGTLGKLRILLEGSQGTLLSVDWGIQPYVTSSDCSLAGLAKGAGLRERDVDLAFGIAKAPYMTRVGEGVFPTEFGGKASAEWCGTSGVTAKTEQEKYPGASVNSSDPLEQGVGIRIAGREYGATTGRPRRTGWLDLPLLRYAMQFADSDLILTKIDVLDRCEEIRLCVAHRYVGPAFNLGRLTIERGMVLDTAIPITEVLEYIEPVYESLPGWMCDTSGIRTWNAVPEKLEAIISVIEQKTGAKVAAVSVGPDREQTIVR